MPFISAAMECSRIPKWIVRPYGFAPGRGLPSGRNDEVLSIVVLFEPARSAEPPHSSGMTAPSACSTLPDAARVATALPVSNDGRWSSQPSGSSPAAIRSNSAACSGRVERQSANPFSHSFLRSRPWSRAARVCASTSSGTSKDFSGSKPRTRLVAATSSSPSAEPCAASVFWALGAGQAMIERIAMNEGRPVSALAASMARYSAAGSRSPFAFGATRCTCQP